MTMIANVNFVFSKGLTFSLNTLVENISTISLNIFYCVVLYCVIRLNSKRILVIQTICGFFNNQFMELQKIDLDLNMDSIDT